MTDSDTIVVRRASNGRYWQAVWVDPRTGAREATAACQQLAAQIRASGLPESRGRDTASLGDCGDAFIARRQHLHSSTLSVYGTTLAKLAEFFGPGRHLKAIGPEDGMEWASWLRSSGLSEGTVRKHIRTARTMFSEAVRLGKTDANPVEGIAAAPQRPVRDWYYVTDDDLEALLDSCPGPGWRCLVALCRLAGLRTGEALRLEWRDVDWSRHRIRIRPQRGRQYEGTKQAERVAPAVPRLYQVLQEAFDAADDGARRVSPIRYGSVYVRFRQIVRDAGLVPWEKPFTTMRRNCRSDWDAIYPAADVSAWLGHSTEVGRRHYHDTTQETWDRATKGDDLNKISDRPLTLR